MHSSTISDAYLKEQRKLHENIYYGVASLSFAAKVADLIRSYNCFSVTDYGAGKRRLLEGLEAEGIVSIDYRPYDPAYPDYGSPMEADLVCCIDVLEHVELDYLEYVLVDLAKLVEKLGFFTIHTGPAQKQLSDGRNAHLIQQDMTWWRPRLEEYFTVRDIYAHQIHGQGFVAMVEKK